jgi:lactate dehydrogenase-like 2-hydroxyacid dehydrogenase
MKLIATFSVGFDHIDIAVTGERIVRAGKWKGWAPTQLLGVTLERKKLGILGFGRIGRELASIARGFQGHRRTGSGGLNEQGPAASAARP